MAASSRASLVVASKVRDLAVTVGQLLPKVDVIDMELDDAGLVPENSLHDISGVVLCDPQVVVQLAGQSDLPLKWVQSTWAGVEGIMSVVQEKKIQPKFLFSRTGDGYGQLIGEYVIAHVIAYERRFKQMFKGNESRIWDANYKYFRSLPSLTIGVLGLGQIGTEISRMCKAMGMTVWGMATGQKKTCPYIDEFRCPDGLSDLLSHCDYICNILPSTPLTRNLLSGEVLACCAPRKSVFINVGRGDIIDEESLINALNQGWLAGAVLDVFVKEPLPESSPLWTMPNVTVSPHVSGPSLNTQIAEGFVQNYELFCEGSPIKYQVDWNRGY